MPKNNPKPQLPRIPRPSDPKTPKGGGGTGGGDCPPEGGQTILVSLIRMNESALPGLQSGDPVSLRPVGVSLQVFTPIGTLIRDTGQSDAELLAGKRVRRSQIFSATTKPAQCIIEVIV